jgi:hypothetical protein
MFCFSNTVFDLISTHAPKSISQQSDYIVCSPFADVVFHSGHATGSDLSQFENYP